MHIEPGILQGAKVVFSYGTALAVFGVTLGFIKEDIKKNKLFSFTVKSLIATICVFIFFEVFPHKAIGISEIHLILGSSLFLILGVAPSAVGLSLGLLIQGLFFAPFDLPQYGANVTTLLAPLFFMSILAKKIIQSNTAYKDIKYSQAFKLSLIYQAGIVSWVAFWALLGRGFGAENIASIASFGIAYLSVVLIEPLIDLALLYFVKNIKIDEFFINKRVYQACEA